jgi:type IX secretion system PorP/SprF family membrane protein
MNAKKNIILVVGILFFISICNGQQEMLYTQYFFNQLSINPAYAGNDDGLSITALSRKQWLGLEGSPTLISLIAHASVMENNPECRFHSSGRKKRKLTSANKQAGLGLVLFNDKVGVDNTFISNFSYSYKILFKNEKRLSFGLQAGILNFRQSFSQLSDFNSEDPVFYENIQITRFNSGAGIFYESDLYFFGFSIPEIIKNSLSPNNISNEKQLRQYFFSGGYIVYLNRLIKFKPTILLRYTERMPAQCDINANFLYMDKLWMGVSFRYNHSVNTTLEFLISNNLRIGVAYDYVTTELNKVTDGSFEIMINYIWRKTKNRIASPRYF